MTITIDKFPQNLCTDTDFIHQSEDKYKCLHDFVFTVQLNLSCINFSFWLYPLVWRPESSKILCHLIDFANNSPYDYTEFY